MLSILYFVAALLVALYGANALLLSVLYLRRGARAAETAVAEAAKAEPAEPEEWPLVTLQLPIYNELHVIRRLLDAVARLDYPRDRLQVQVLDDSTDETTRLARACVAHHRAHGLDVELLHRATRTGFKAGALAHGMARARGELIAVLDADFVPAPDFLKRTVPHLAARPDLAFVQARWGYLNAGYSLLTRVQTIALDGHFVVEHIGRNRNGLAMNFNGTAGVWRRVAIEDAGGWQSDTLTEDVDLSFRAQLAGWHALYLPDVAVPAELPPQMAAFKRQQARWATGAAQCLVKLAPSLLRGFTPPLPPPQGGGDSL
ncbi:MAG TPA: cellulose synthase family protein, partial [Anaerolineae bacterium]|nr:cellulose synthase family protein [Anaerolineae bacterium]